MIFVFPTCYPIFLRPSVEENVISPLNYLGIFVKNWSDKCKLFLHSLLLYVSLCQYCISSITNFIIILEVMYHKSSKFVLNFQYQLANSRTFAFYINFKISFLLIVQSLLRFLLGLYYDIDQFIKGGYINNIEFLTYLVKFSIRISYFHVTVNGTFKFLISKCLLLVYKNTIYFYILAFILRFW